MSSDDIARAKKIGETIADLMITPGGREMLLEIAGLTGRPAIMDATKEQFEHAARRARYAVAAADEIARFEWDAARWPALGAFVAALPDDVRERVGDLLWRAGLS